MPALRDPSPMGKPSHVALHLLNPNVNHLKLLMMGALNVMDLCTMTMTRRVVMVSMDVLMV